MKQWAHHTDYSKQVFWVKGPDTKDYIHKTSFSNENIGFNFLEVWGGLALIPLMHNADKAIKSRNFHRIFYHCFNLLSKKFYLLLLGAHIHDVEGRTWGCQSITKSAWLTMPAFTCDPGVKLCSPGFNDKQLYLPAEPSRWP